jgi:SIT family siderophore-iron:H+ symporter-like MFS transporter
MPLIVSLIWSSQKPKRSGALDSYRTPYHLYSPKKLFVALFWQLYIPGVVLLTAVFRCILTVSYIHPSTYTWLT